MALQEQSKEEVKKTGAVERQLEAAERKQLLAERGHRDAERRGLEAVTPFKVRAGAAQRRLAVREQELEVTLLQPWCKLDKLCCVSLACPKQIMALLH